MKILRRLGAYFSPEPQAGAAAGRSSGSEEPQNRPRGERQGRKRRVRRPILEGRPTVFFVVGHGKSGTTWLARLLGSHPEVLCLWEGRFIGKEWHREDLGEVEANVPPRTLSGAIANSRDLRLWAERSVWARRGDADDHLANLTRLALDYFLDQRLAGTDKKIVGDKTPFLPGAHTVREIHAIYPEARVIHVIRDGRDAEVSWMHHRWNRSREQGGIQVLRPGEAERREAYLENPRGAAGPGLFDEAELRARAAQWRETVGEAMREGPELLGDNYTEVRYESLLADAPAETARLLRFLGAGAGEGSVRRCVEEASFEKVSGGRRPGEEDPTSMVRKGVSGDWRGAFTESDRRIFKEEAGDLLVELGYEKDHDW
jgi:sulfotransferase family protein